MMNLVKQVALSGLWLLSSSLVVEAQQTIFVDWRIPADLTGPLPTENVMVGDTIVFNWNADGLVGYLCVEIGLEEREAGRKKVQSFSRQARTKNIFTHFKFFSFL